MELVILQRKNPFGKNVKCTTNILNEEVKKIANSVEGKPYDLAPLSYVRNGAESAKIEFVNFHFQEDKKGRAALLNPASIVSFVDLFIFYFFLITI